ncbi:Putative F-box domain-containing protein [Septoria linicola]|uniref:F-box domain-containing protein n=1 Tax=Septoria linicola TaxID=215465 RepID=A0A9Q9B3E1_9PEZI|nr:Putative F-box domain-containing protein [Septoria linicola]
MAPRHKRLASAAQADELPDTKRRQTRRSTRASADPPRQAVFNTGELLEQSLVQLTPLEIVSARRVCSQWRDCIHRAVNIRDKLHMRVDVRAGETWSGRSSTGQPFASEDRHIDAILKRTSSTADVEGADQDFRRLVTAPGPHRYVIPVSVSPFFEIRRSVDRRSILSEWPWGDPYKHVHAVSWATLELTKAIERALEGENMPLLDRLHFTSIPSVTIKTWYQRWTFGKKRDSIEYKELPSRSEGWTVGDLVRSLLETRKKCDNPHSDLRTVLKLHRAKQPKARFKLDGPLRISLRANLLPRHEDRSTVQEVD